MSDRKCENCQFWGALYDVPGMIGLCRRNPPMTTEAGDGFWPRVEPDDWCGEFVAKEETHD